jgi:hypothetical protein
VIIVDNWRIVGLFAFLTIVFLGFCVYATLENTVNHVIPTVDGIGSLTQATILSNEIVPLFFWVELGFVAIGVGVGLKIEPQIVLESRKKVGGYIISASAILGVCLYIALNYLVYNLIYQLVPPLTIDTYRGTYDLHTFIQSTILNDMIFSRLFWSAFFYVALGVAFGGVIGFFGSQMDRET